MNEKQRYLPSYAQGVNGQNLFAKNKDRLKSLKKILDNEPVPVSRFMVILSLGSLGKLHRKGSALKLSKYQAYKESVLHYYEHLSQKGYTVGTGGNLSILIEGQNAIAITPTNMDYFGIHVDDICIVDFDMNVLEGNFKPSIETKMHIEVYKNRLDVNAIIHTHQVYASIFALINEPIPALFDEVTLNTGHIIDVIPYALSGSNQLSKNVLCYLSNRCNCYIIQNHGGLSLGISIENAFRNVELLEKVSRSYYYALSTGRSISKLPDSCVVRLCKMLYEKQDEEIARKKANQS